MQHLDILGEIWERPGERIDTRISHFSHNSEKKTISYVMPACLSVRPYVCVSAWNNSAATARLS
jgi:hypothetical protein